jgi:excisionase family DNA binding protein
VTDRLLTAHQVAGKLAVSVETVLRWARAGELPSFHLSNRAIRFRETDLDAWLEERAIPVQGGVTHPDGHRPQGKIVSVTHPRCKE